MLVPLFKIPLIATAVGLHYSALKAPNPPPMTGKDRRGFFERTVMYSIPFNVFTQKFIAGTIAIAESATLLAYAYPDIFHKLGFSSYSILDTITVSPSITAATEALTTSNLIPFTIGTGFMIAGALLRTWCFRTLGKMFTFQVKVQDKHELVTSGPYSYVRHPSYTGQIMIYVGLFIWQATSGSYFRTISGVWDYPAGKAVIGLAAFFHLALTTAFLERVPTEDALLREHFGAQWYEWAERVPYKLIPYVY